MNRVIHKCWAGEFASVDSVLQVLKSVHERLMAVIMDKEVMPLEEG